MALGTTNISTNLVKNEIGESINNVGGLCVSTNVNMWAKRKPVRDSRIAVPESEVGVAGGTYGLSIPAYTGDDTALTTYLKPRGSANNEPCRLGDFRGYDHTAPLPVSLLPEPSELEKRVQTITAFITLPEAGAVSINDIDGDLRLGVLVYETGGGLIGAASGQNAGDASVEIDLSSRSESAVDLLFCLTDYFKDWDTVGGLTTLYEIPRKISTQNKNWTNVSLIAYNPPVAVPQFDVIWEPNKDRVKATVETSTYTGTASVTIVPNSGSSGGVMTFTIATAGVAASYYDNVMTIEEGMSYTCYLRFTNIDPNSTPVATTTFTAFQPI